MSGGMRRPVTPLRHLPVPGMSDVVILPVITYNESDNANTNSGTVVDHGNGCPLVEVIDASRIHPAPVFARNNVTPAVIWQTPLNRYREPASQDCHHGIVPGRPGVQGDSLGGVSQLGICRSRNNEHCGSKNQCFQIVHVSPPCSIAAVATQEFRLASPRDDSGKQLFQSVSARRGCSEDKARGH
jgi:hypothetical protein